jgi:uncharacterized protein YcnI
MTIRRIAAAACVAALALPAAAQAHVSLHPNTLPTGSNATVEVRVPNETSNARVTRVELAVPPGFTFLLPQPVPGWNARVVHEKLAKPIKTDDGVVTEQAKEVVWTATKGGGTPPGEFQGFPVVIGVPGRAGDVLAFKTVQRYSDGSVVRWIEPADGDHPAPTVNVTAAGGFLQDQAGDAGPPAPGTTPAGGSTTTTKPAGRTPPAPATSSSGGASKGLGIAALVVGALALLVGLGALARARRAPEAAG